MQPAKRLLHTFPINQTPFNTTTVLLLCCCYLLLDLPVSVYGTDDSCRYLSEGAICNPPAGRVCHQGKCVSACVPHGMQQCNCDDKEDDFCYLCCGSHSRDCAPAHSYGIRRPNGERWEKDVCKRCRDKPDGMRCDDKDDTRLCYSEKCTNKMCHTKSEGVYCDLRKERVCSENECTNPCAAIMPHLMICECEEIDPQTGYISSDRCQLCCYDFNTKKCENAYRTYGVEHSLQKRPFFRTELPCHAGKTCNKYGICAAQPRAKPGTLTLMLIVSAFGVLVAIRTFC